MTDTLSAICANRCAPDHSLERFRAIAFAQCFDACAERQQAGIGDLRTIGRSRSKPQSVRPDHFVHGFGRHLEVVSATPRACDRSHERGVVDAIPDKCFVDMDCDDFAECQPGFGVSLLARPWKAGVLDTTDPAGPVWRVPTKLSPWANRGLVLSEPCGIAHA